MAIIFDTLAELEGFRATFHPVRKPRLQAPRKARTSARSRSQAMQIRRAIQQRLQEGKPFTHNDVVALLPGDWNRASVITSVFKQMKTTYRNVNRTTRPGGGPRPAIVYTP